VTFRLSLDSSIFIAQLTGDVHAEAVLAALTVLETMSAELTLPLLRYAELWTGVELLPEVDRPAAAATLDRVVRASRVMLVADNVAIAREAARAQAAYRRRGGRREVLIPPTSCMCLIASRRLASRSRVDGLGQQVNATPSARARAHGEASVSSR
jgi:predicted nucleic acid-binding protein